MTESIERLAQPKCDVGGTAWNRPERDGRRHHQHVQAGRAAGETSWYLQTESGAITLTHNRSVYEGAHRPGNVKAHGRGARRRAYWATCESSVVPPSSPCDWLTAQLNRCRASQNRNALVVAPSTTTATCEPWGTCSSVARQ